MNMHDAISAYRTASKGLQQAAPGAKDEPTGPSFGSLVKAATQNTINAQKQSEQMGRAAVMGKADMTDVVMAVTNAETTLQSVVAVRDKVVSAYQEIMRMPI